VGRGGPSSTIAGDSPTELTEKKCQQCKKKKPVTEFYRSQWRTNAIGKRVRSGDGYRGWCRVCANKSRTKRRRGQGAREKKSRLMDLELGTRCCKDCGNHQDPATWKPLDEFYPPTITIKKGRKRTMYRSRCIKCDNKNRAERSKAKRKKQGRELPRRTPEMEVKSKECARCGKEKTLVNFKMLQQKVGNPYFSTTCFSCKRNVGQREKLRKGRWYSLVLREQQCQLCSKWKHFSKFDNAIVRTVTGKQIICRHCKSKGQIMSVTAYESNDGSIYISNGTLVYETNDKESLDGDMQCVLMGNTDGWTVPTYTFEESKSMIEHPETKILKLK